MMVGKSNIGRECGPPTIYATVRTLRTFLANDSDLCGTTLSMN